MRVVPGEPRITYTIDFSHPLIRRQRFTVPMASEDFAREIASARTFGFLKEVQYLQTNGLALGGSLDNAVVLDDAGVLNPGGFRFPDECVRHKILDAVGDLALLGLPLYGRLEVSRGSHEFHLRFLEHLMGQESAWRIWLPSPRHPGETTFLVSTHPVGGGDRLRVLNVWLWGGGQAMGPALFFGEKAISGQLSAI